MPRQIRVQYKGALYHVLSRGNRREKIFRDASDKELFLETLGEVCERTGWKIHAYVLMDNHYHLLIETPEANLVAGMKWLQGTYTQRFNSRHKLVGHLFQGRYKALLIDPSETYFLRVSTYIHLNPVRAKIVAGGKKGSASFPWSSYGGYVEKRKRMEWLCVDKVLSCLKLLDTTQGRKKYREYLEQRINELRKSGSTLATAEEWGKLRRGWCFGSESFRDKSLKKVAKALSGKNRTSYSGRSMKGHDEKMAEFLVKEGMKVLGLSDKDLERQRKGSPEKICLAWLVRKNTSVQNGWIANRLSMGRATNMAHLLKRVESDLKNSKMVRSIKNVKL